ncbi:MAG: SsrA-binding protein SmpB [Fimbriimonadaceae bacterium]|nr:SsrA-binding protein SmpB [Fimbriimonadaceae bacterium]
MAKKDAEAKHGPPTIHNRRARFDYEILDSIEAGLVLVGSEVKSVWNGRANIGDAYCKFVNGEAWVLNLDIEPYEKAVHFLPERRRDRKLLMHRSEIEKLARRVQEKGLTLVPLKLYFNHGKVKLEIGLARGRKSYDKRDAIAKKDERRDTERMHGAKRRL